MRSIQDLTEHSRLNWTPNKRLYWILVLFNILDTVFTTLLVLSFGAEAEANPIVRYLIIYFGVAAIGLFKIPFLLLLYIYLDRVWTWMLYFVVVVYALVVGWGGSLVIGKYLI